MLAALTKEQVGLVLVGLAVWMAWRHPGRRRAAAVLAAGGLAWVVIALTVIMPAFAIDGSNPHLGRYSSLGNSPIDIAVTFVTRPWDAVAVIATPGRAVYLVALLLPLLLLPLAAPVLALAAVPQLLINLFASSGPVQTVDYHYAVVLVPFLVAATLLGLANLRERGVPARLEPWIRRPGLMAGTLVGAVLVAGVFQGPLPLWGWLPGGYGGSALHRFRDDDQTRALREALALIPADARVSAANGPGSHLSARGDPAVPEDRELRLRAARRQRTLPRDGARPSHPAPARLSVRRPAPPRARAGRPSTTARASRSTGGCRGSRAPRSRAAPPPRRPCARRGCAPPTPGPPGSRRRCPRGSPGIAA